MVKADIKEGDSPAMPSGSSARKVSELDPQTIKHWRNQGMVFLVGSLVSTYSPTSLPLGKTMSRALCEWLFEDCPDWLKRDVERLPFEALMECYPDQEALPHIVQRIFCNRKRNRVHSSLISSLQRAAIQGLITTNYDLAFEACFTGDLRVISVYDPQSCERYLDSVAKPAVCFKIHGSADEKLEHTLVYRLKQEGWIHPSKRKLLCELLRNRILVVTGYSGCDFDICPELAETTEQQLTVWLQKDNQEAQPNAKRVLEKREGFFLIGDFLEFLSIVLEENLEDCTSPSQRWEPQVYFERDLIKQWRLQILNWIACGELGEKYLSEFTGDDVAKRKFRAGMWGHLGRYHDAVRELEANLRLPRVSLKQRMERKLDAAGARFIYGQHLWGRHLLHEVERSLRKAPRPDRELETKAAETGMMMSMRLAQVLYCLRCGWLLTFLKPKLQKVYERARSYLEKAGEWGRLEALQINAERIGIARQEGLPFPSREGYRALGMVSMEVIATRDRIRSTRGKLTGEMQSEADSCLERAEQYGWHHEAWKFHWILLWRGPRHKTKHLKGWWSHFWKTQYAPLARILHLALNLVPRDVETSAYRRPDAQRRTSG